MEWVKLVVRRINGIEMLVFEEHKSLNDLEDWKPVLPPVIQIYNGRC